MTRQHEPSGSDASRVDGTVDKIIKAVSQKVEQRSGDAKMCASDEGVGKASTLRQTGGDDGIANTAAVEQLGAQLAAQSW